MFSLCIQTILAKGQKRAHKRLDVLRCRFAMRYTCPNNLAPLERSDRDPGAARSDNLANDRSHLAEPRWWFDTEHRERGIVHHAPASPPQLVPELLRQPD